MGLSMVVLVSYRTVVLALFVMSGRLLECGCQVAGAFLCGRGRGSAWLDHDRADHRRERCEGGQDVERDLEAVRERGGVERGDAGVSVEVVTRVGSGDRRGDGDS